MEQPEYSWSPTDSILDRREISKVRTHSGIVTVYVRRGMETYLVDFPQKPPRKLWRWTLEPWAVRWHRFYDAEHGRPWVWCESYDEAMTTIACILTDRPFAKPGAADSLLSRIRDRVAVEMQLLDT